MIGPGGRPRHGVQPHGTPRSPPMTRSPGHAPALGPRRHPLLRTGVAARHRGRVTPHGPSHHREGDSHAQALLRTRLDRRRRRRRAGGIHRLRLRRDGRLRHGRRRRRQGPHGEPAGRPSPGTSGSRSTRSSAGWSCPVVALALGVVSFFVRGVPRAKTHGVDLSRSSSSRAAPGTRSRDLPYVGALPRRQRPAHPRSSRSTRPGWPRGPTSR